MNVVKLMGGIGNQLWQYAFGRAQMQNGLEVWYDNSFYANASYNDKFPRLYHLDKFDIIVPLRTASSRMRTVRDFKMVTPGILTRDDSYFDGYWQFYAYIKDILPELRKEIWLRNEFKNSEFERIKYRILSSDSIAIHVRRGDYLTHRRNSYVELGFNYFMRARSFMPTDLPVFIFSDDIPWCQEKFKPIYFSKPITFVDLIEYQSFELMRLCKHHIIANSTFSYWAALLGDSPEQIVVCPKEWMHGKEEDKDNELIFPKKWTKIIGNVIQDV